MTTNVDGFEAGVTRRSFLAATGASLAASAPGIAVRGGRAWSQDAARPTAEGVGSADVLKQMRRIAEGVRLAELEGGPPGRQVPLRGEPLLRYSDPPRAIHDASLWTWTRGEKGRPLATLKVEYMPVRPPERRWVLGLVSLAPSRLEAVFHDGLTWASDAPGYEPRPIPDAPAPAGSATVRQAQARDLVRRFAADEFAGPLRRRLPLRLMPRPLLRFADPDAGLLDGLLFAFAYGTNPDILVALEARQRPGPLAWYYGVGRLGGAEGVVSLDGQGVWSVPGADPPRQLGTYMNRRIAEGDEPK